MNNEIIISLVPLAAGFVAYFALHSLLASHQLKNYVAVRWPTLMPAYRLAFNVISVVLLIPLVWLMQLNPGPVIWQWHGNWSLLMNGLMLAAIGGFIWSLKSYDNMVFLGWTQWKNRHRGCEDPEQLHISTLHRFVRHPWYFFILVILWTQDIHLTQLVTYGLMTLYFIIGSYLEERKLMECYGDAYRQYCQRVPGLVPLPWRWLSEAKAIELINMAKGGHTINKSSN
jgi:protein-S-isoprenylcysteine O-methyltransferase Ste14